ncbi:MAG TPA: NUDIX hydrolase [Actinospica sp.]|nr:NUDIX hydrolase [Actinospica sp.]
MPAARHDTAWMNGAMPVRITAYPDPEHIERLPLEIVSSIRCIVRVADKYVFCENRSSRHPWPGGRRNPGETHADTAVREVHEETGWLVRPETMRPLGWLHLRHLGPEPEGNQGPYPDFLQLVFTARADRRDGDLPEDAPWTDTDDYELSSRLVALEDAIARTSRDMHAQVFLELLRPSLT